MCFSSNASFGASAVLAVVGVVAIAKAKNTPGRLFAAIPFIFSIQQFAEGMLWLSMKEHDIGGMGGMSNFSTNHPFFRDVFLVFALVLWPFYVPFTVWLLENNKKRKRILSVPLAAGIAVSLCLLYVLLTFPVQVMGEKHHIHFEFDLPVETSNVKWLISLLYFMSTIAAPFISSNKRMKWLGLAFLLSYTIAVIFYSGFFVSVWCYFAALLSVLVLWIVVGFNKPLHH